MSSFRQPASLACGRDHDPGRVWPYQSSTSLRAIDTRGGSRTSPVSRARSNSVRLNHRASAISVPSGFGVRSPPAQA